MRFCEGLLRLEPLIAKLFYIDERGEGRDKVYSTTKNEIYQFCKLFGLEEDINKKYKYYSLGMKQKLRIIQAIMESPNILILDEPFDALDKQAKQIMQNYLNDFIKKENHYLIYTSHSNEHKEFADVIYSIDAKTIKEIKNVE